MDKITSRDIQKVVLELSGGERHDRYKQGNLAPKTIKNYIAFISTIYEHAIKMQVASHNPCKAVTLPKAKSTEREIYSPEEMQIILELLHQEDEKDFHFILYFTLAVFTGFRRGELLGLEWRDICFDRNLITINRTSNYTRDKGIFTDTPKTKTSYRTIVIHHQLMDFLAQYKVRQAEYAESLGDKWETTDRLFTQWDGKPMFPNSPSLYFERFCKRHGLRYLNLHSCRHFTASALINARLDVKTVQSYLGHSTPTTTLGIYCHEFNVVQAMAMGAIASVIAFPTSGMSAKS
jgi:integrase